MDRILPQMPQSSRASPTDSATWLVPFVGNVTSHFRTSDELPLPRAVFTGRLYLLGMRLTYSHPDDDDRDEAVYVDIFAMASELLRTDPVRVSTDDDLSLIHI